MDRRNFIKSTCNVCMLGTAGLIIAELSSCGPGTFPIFKADVINKTVTVPLSLFEKSTLQIVRPKNMFYDIAVYKKEDDSYSALLLLCTHQENQLIVTANGYNCTLHGSHFDKNGEVTKGPASKPLQQFRTIISNSDLIIQI